MAKVSLRVYNREIEGMIEGGRLDEAVAHCQHILKTFPMHVETYRLMGKSFLEARRYTDAADIFQRVLMAVPDDFVAHVGMSIIRDDESKMDAAIWHMERAFEGQPSNPAIQAELRRLYGRRDGVEPPKIRLSRDALANMYAQGELFNQAIAEIRAILAEDANRPDLQVMLARAYYRSGQKVEAAEMAANLLKKYTYCMDALRILVDVLPGTARVENTQVYRQRLNLLDPYSAFMISSAFNTDQVAEAAVKLERLEYKASAAPTLTQPNWASSLGIKLTDEKRAQPVPDWMKTVNSSEQFPAAQPKSSGHATVPTADDKSIPDWMRTPDWQVSSGKTQEGPADLSAEQPAETLARADIPDWLRAMAPKEVTDAANTGSEPAPANPPTPDKGDVPDWLAEPGPAATEASPGPSEPAASSMDNGVFPDWLKEIGDIASTGTAATFTADALNQPQAEETPGSIQPAPPPSVAQAPVEPPVSALHPDVDIPFQPTGGSKPLKIEDDTMAWLESLTAKQGVKGEELQTKPENRLEEMPDWLRSADEQPVSPAGPEPPPAPSEIPPVEVLSPTAGEVAAQEPAPSEELPPLTPPAEGTGQPVNIEDDAMAWLESLAAKQGIKEEELQTKPENHLGEMPDWLRPANEQPVSPAGPESSPAPSEIPPVEVLSPTAGEVAAREPAPSEEPSPLVPPAERTSQPLNIEDDTMAWLESLAAKQGAKEEELLTKPENRSGEMPDWLRSANEQPASPAGPEPPPAPSETLPVEVLSPTAGEVAAREPAPSEELPPLTPPAEGTGQPVNIEEDAMAWLESLAAKQGAKEEELLTKPENQLGEMPDWLRPANEQPVSPAAPEPSPAPSETLPLEPPIPLAGEVAAREPAPSEELPPLTPPAEGTGQPLKIEDDTMAWMEGLQAEQGAIPEELPTKPGKRSETPPDWIQETNPEPPAPEEAAAPETPQQDATITTWLRKQDVQEALRKDQPAPDISQPVTEPSNELPDWLKELDKPAAEEEAPKPAEDLPDWLRHPAQPTDEGTIAIPTPEPAPEPEMPAWIDEEIQTSEQPAPTTPAEWVPVDEKPAPVPDKEPIAEPTSSPEKTLVLPRVLGGTGMLAHIPAEDRDAESLAAAQAALNANKLNEAMKAYTTLIKKNHLLDEVIHDLGEAIYRFPVDIVVWQTLGDACMRSNRLQDALDAYTKAEELLR